MACATASGRSEAIGLERILLFRRHMDMKLFGYSGARRGRSSNPDIGIRTLSSLLVAMAMACSSAAQPSGAGGSAGAGTGGVGGGVGVGGAGGTVKCSPADPPAGGCGCQVDLVFYVCSSNGSWVCPAGTVPRGTCSCIGNNCPPDASADVPDSSIDAGGDSPYCSSFYRSPGCDEQTPPPFCDDGNGGACGGAVCDCHNTVHYTYCDRSDVMFRYFFSGGPIPAEGDACNAVPDAGQDH
jgi:hypothetical protein